jgi:4-hydroxybenzoate polyprenyltransferase
VRDAVATPSPIAALRARQWAHFVVLPLASAGGAGRLAVGFALAATALAYAYGLNAISDRATDLDARKNPLAGVAATPGAVLILVAGCALVALGLALFVGAAPLVGVSLVASTVYSAGSKRVPAIGSLLNVAIFAPLLFLGGGAPPWPIVSTFAVLLLQNQLLHECADAVEDAAAAAHTTARAIGARSAVALAATLGAGGVAAAFALAAGWTAWLAALASLAGALVAVAGPRDFAARRVAHRWVALTVGALLFAVAR